MSIFKQKEDPALRGRELFKALHQGLTDLEEKGAKYHDSITDSMWKSIREIEQIAVEEGYYAYSHVKDGSVGNYGRKVERSELVVNAAQEALSQNENAIEASISNLENLRIDDNMGIQAAIEAADRMRNILGFRFAVEEAKRLVALRRTDFAKAQSVFSQWEKEHGVILELLPLIEEWNKEHHEFLILHEPHDTFKEREAHKEEVSSSITAAKKYVEDAMAR